MSRLEDRRQARDGLKVLTSGRQPLVAAVDLGASKVTCFIMKPDGVRRGDQTLVTAGVGYVQSRGVKGGVKGGADVGDLNLSTTTLDLSVAENRAAFDQVFTVYGVDAGEVHAKVADIRLDGGIPGLVTAWSGLQQRLDADGFEASYQYETTGDSLSATGGEKAAKAGGWGVGGEKTDSGRELVSAVARDNRLGGVEVPLATCEK